VRVLLIHGTDDDDGSLLVTYSFASALRRAGHEVSTKIMNGVDHQDVIQAEIVEPLLASWISALAAAASPTPLPSPSP
jgi:dipeptidyl aminopeptidase/acylaminoacyl peptidase